MLVHLGDIPGATIRMLRKRILWANKQSEKVNEMMQEGSDCLKSDMCEYWYRYMEDSHPPIADAAYMLDPQWVNKSKDAGAVVKENLWNIAKEILCKGHRGMQWQPWDVIDGMKHKIKRQLQAFYFRTGHSLGICNHKITYC